MEDTIKRNIYIIGESDLLKTVTNFFSSSNDSIVHSSKEKESVLDLPSTIIFTTNISDSKELKFARVVLILDSIPSFISPSIIDIWPSHLSKEEVNKYCKKVLALSRANNANSESNAYIESIFAIAPYAFISTDANFNAVNYSHLFKKITGLNENQLSRFNYLRWKENRLIVENNEQNLYSLYFEGQKIYLKETIKKVYDSNKIHTGYLICFIDLTNELNYKVKTQLLLNTDSLTGLHSRYYFYNYLKEHTNIPISIFYIDVDNFKQVNDMYGHFEGDNVLRRIGNLIKGFFPEAHISRIGGDEYTIISKASYTEEFITDLSKKLNETVSTYYDSIPLGISLGYVHSGAGYDPDELVNEADKQMYGTKKKHKECLFNDTCEEKK